MSQIPAIPSVQEIEQAVLTLAKVAENIRVDEKCDTCEITVGVNVWESRAVVFVHDDDTDMDQSGKLF